MEISMTMLKWYLKDMNPKCHIEQDKRMIKRLRVLFHNEQPIEPECLYIADVAEGISSKQYSGSCIIINRKSYIIFSDMDSNEILNRILMAFDFFNQWEHQLMELKVQKAPIQKFLEISDNIFHNPIAVEDKFFHVFAHTNSNEYQLDPIWKNMKEGNPAEKSPMNEPLFDAVTGQLIQDITISPQLVRNVYPGGAPVIMLYIDQNDEHIGMMTVLTENSEMREMNLQLAGFLAEYISGAKELFEIASLRPRTRLLLELLDGKLSAMDIDPIIRSIVPAPWRLLCIKNPLRKDTLNRDAFAARIMKNKNRCVASVSEDSVLLLMSEEDYDADLKTYRDLLDIHRMNITVSTSFEELGDLYLMYRQLCYSSQIGNENPGIYHFEEYAIPYLMEFLWKDPMTSYLIHPGIYELEVYDNEHNTDLLRTLEVFIKMECSSLKTAETLFIHPNSMKYRLKRIRNISGLTLSEPMELNHLRISFWLQDYLR